MSEIRIRRLDDELLVLDGLALARAFFGGEPRETPPAGDPLRIDAADVAMLNRMRARSPRPAWADVVGSEAPWLAAIPVDLDLLATDAAAWTAAGGDELVSDALAALLGPRRGMSVVTKLLHLKRPALFPMLDRFVAEMLGLNAAEGAPDRKLADAVRLMQLIRTEGRANLMPLREIQRTLAAEGIERSLVRLLDAVVWLAHPAAGVRDARRTLHVRLG